MQRAAQKLLGTVVVGLCAAPVTVIVGIATPQPAHAAEAEAKSLLKAMSDYLAAQKAISFDFDTSLEIVTAELQKIALASSGTVTVNRPDKMRATQGISGDACGWWRLHSGLSLSGRSPKTTESTR